MQRLSVRPGPKALLLFALLTSLAACGSSPQPVHLTEEWPANVDSYRDVTDRWTRHGILRASFSDQGSQLLEVYATFLSSEWRAAYVERQAKLQTLSAASRKELEDAQRAIAAENHQVKLLISTYHPQHNELHRERSIWRVVLVDDAGNEIAVSSIEKDRRPRQLIAAEFDNFGDFSEAYIASFPHEAALLRGKAFSLRVTSSLGTVQLGWRGRQRER